MPSSNKQAAQAILHLVNQLKNLGEMTIPRGLQRSSLFVFFLFFAASTNSEITYIHTDHLGSVVAESDQTGSVTQRSHYLSFGETLDLPSDDVGYTGHKFDKDLGLSYMQARYYDPSIGRFLSNDPIGTLGHLSQGNIQGFNRYAYANNNPYKYVDPDGKAAFLAFFLPFLGGGGGAAATTTAVSFTATEIAVGVVAGTAIAGTATVLMNESSDPVGDLIDTTTPGEKTKGRTTNHEKPGDIGTANDDFDGIVDPDSVEDRGNGVRTGKTEDGRKVNVRPNSSDGRPTIEIQDGKNKDKIRYDEAE